MAEAVAPGSSSARSCSTRLASGVSLGGPAARPLGGSKSCGFGSSTSLGGDFKYTRSRHPILRGDVCVLGAVHTGLGDFVPRLCRYCRNPLRRHGWFEGFAHSQVSVKWGQWQEELTHLCTSHFPSIDNFPPNLGYSRTKTMRPDSKSAAKQHPQARSLPGLNMAKGRNKEEN